MSLRKRLALALPRKDPRPGYTGDELRVISPRSVRPYLSKMIPNLDDLSARFARAKGRVDYKRGNSEEQVRQWTSGDAAIVVRLRGGRPIKMVFLEQESRRRIRTKMYLGRVEGRAAFFQRALFAIGIREIVATIADPKLAARMKRIGYRQIGQREFLLKLGKRR